MDSYINGPRSPADRDRNWSRDESRPRDQRDNFYRGRSPGHDRRRGRSRSPHAIPIDRYEPRVRHDHPVRDRPDREERTRRVVDSPANIDRYVPGQDNSGVITMINPLQEPSKLSYQVGFSYFGEWWRINERIDAEKERIRTGRRREPERARVSPEEREKEKARIQAAYDSYKEELQARMARDFTNEHKKEQWFRERYVPEVRDAFRKQLGEFRRGLYTQWESDLEAGLFDEYSLEGIPKSEAGANGAVVEKEEGETTATSEVMGVGDLVAASGADIRDENLFLPTLLIKTIAPHVSRQNLENFCREHLGEDEGGFKWLSLSDPNPSKRYHRIGWVMLHPSSDTQPVVDRADPKDDDDDDEMQAKAPAKIPTAEKALEAVNGKTVKDEVRGDFVCHVGVHNPPMNPRRKALWDLFSAPERIEKDLKLACRLVDKFEEEYGSDFNANFKISERVDELRNSGRLCLASAKRMKRQQRQQQQQQVHDFDMDAGPEDGDEGSGDEDDGAVDEDDADGEDLIARKKQLDLTIEYLRRVFSFCFFCVFESDSMHELARKCPGGHLRRPRSSLTPAAREVARASAGGDAFPNSKRSEPCEEGEVDAHEADKKFRSPVSKTEQQLLRAYNWVRTFEDKVAQILEPDTADLRKLGGRPVEEMLHEELSKHVKHEEEGKWRCKVPECAKLFKEEHFWRKHAEKRHNEWVDALKQDFELINAYVIDPAHIAPSRTDANSNGHFPQSNGQNTTGTPRGFNLQNFSINNNVSSGLAGLPPMPGGNFPAFGGQALAAGNWNMSGAERPSGGPIRRGGMFGGRGGGGGGGQFRTGPYDRRHNPRWDARGRGGFAGGAGRWGDGGAGGAMAPREAVQGRSLKSYEDLDQTAGNGSNGLNY